VKKLEDKEQIMMTTLADAEASKQIISDTLSETNTKVPKLGYPLCQLS
jgi:hypothetical protein